MCAKLSPRDLNLDPCLSHPTSTYTCRVTIVLRVCGGVIWGMNVLAFKGSFILIWGMNVLTFKSTSIRACKKKTYYAFSNTTISICVGAFFLAPKPKDPGPNTCGLVDWAWFTATKWAVYKPSGAQSKNPTIRIY